MSSLTVVMGGVLPLGAALIISSKASIVGKSPCFSAWLYLVIKEDKSTPAYAFLRSSSGSPSISILTP